VIAIVVSFDIHTSGCCNSRALVDCAEEEGRVVLTGDRAFIERRYCDAAYFVRGADKRSQLQEARVATRA
jgi:uncharacterized protein with PIN domain